jgi:DNA-binding IclR family transcriptional regulator
MAYVADKKEILNVLVENLNNDHPQIVEAHQIAERLNMSQKEIRRIVKMMHHVGEVESDLDGERLVITQRGLSWMASHPTAFKQI